MTHVETLQATKQLYRKMSAEVANALAVAREINPDETPYCGKLTGLLADLANDIAQYNRAIARALEEERAKAE